MIEEWKPAVGWDGYVVSNEGAVRSVSRRVLMKNGRWKTVYGRDRRLTPDGFGYPTVGLSVNGVSRTVRVHTLVAATFHGPRPDGFEVRHLDGNPGNNRADNLAYGTSADNKADQIRHQTGPRGERNHASKLTEPDVVRARSLVANGIRIADVARLFGVTWATMKSAVSGRTWSHVVRA